MIINAPDKPGQAGMLPWMPGERVRPGESPTKTIEGEVRPTPLGAIVRVVDGEAEPMSFRLEHGSCIIGSSRNANIVIGVATVSRKHAELRLVPEGVLVQDLESRNGTFYNGQRVERMVLGRSGRITVGPATLSIEVDTESLAHAPASVSTTYRGIVGISPAIRGLFSVLGRLEGSLVTVLIEGDSGVGKERVAHALHTGSVVGKGPFVAVNCSALARELVGSELFGHRRGAFSGAQESRKGAFRSADGGTLFLDEIGDLPLDQQPILLRALELGEVRAVGDDTPHQVSVRVIAATNRDLEADVAAGKFRRDLFYRLAVVRLRVPPLSERPEDIAVLARHFAAEAGLGDLPEEVSDELRARAWPGNARELKNAISAYSALGQLPERPRVDQAELRSLMNGLVDLSRPYAEQKELLTDAFTQAYLEALMRRAEGNQSEAARISGLHRNHLARLLNKNDRGDES
jgi:DNA-binding NtrC family response regulator